MSQAKLGTVDPKSLVEPRLAIHWAAQIASAAGNSRLPAEKDTSHTNLGWAHDLDALVTHPFGDQLMAGLVPATLELIVVRAGEVLQSQALSGKTLDEGMAWLQRALDEASGEAVTLARPEHDMPAHPAGEGAAFGEATAGAYAEIGQWFHLAHHLLTEVADAQGDRAATPRCWPHHFDIATLVTVEEHDDPEEAKSVGVGMTPGDTGYPEPYFYVTPWPYPSGDTLPELGVGRWHTEGWVGAVLVGSALMGKGDATAEARRFVEGAVAASLGIVGDAS